MSVEGFRILDNDLTANTFGTTEYDQNGEVAALIKVVTREKGFVFDGGMLGIVKTIQKAGEVWVYVPYGLQRITIAHPDFGIIRDYYFSEPVEKARTYELRLKTVRPESTESKATPTVSVTFDNPTANSGIYLNGAFMGTGNWTGLVAASTFVLEVKQEGFATYSTTITIDAEKPEQTISIPPLEPVKGNIMANSIPDNATVYMGGELKGNSPLLIENLEAGNYDLEFRLRGYQPYSTSVTVKSDETYKSDAVLKRVNNNVYAGAGYQTGHISGINAFVGAYYWNFNIEVGYLKHSVSNVSTNWLITTNEQLGVTSLIKYEFALKDVYTLSIGYGIPLWKRMCLTPGLGVTMYGMEGECSYQDSYLATYVAANNVGKASTYTLSGLATARFEISPVKYVSLFLSPAFEIPLSMGSLAQDLNDNTDMVRSWCSGFSVKAGIKLCY